MPLALASCGTAGFLLLYLAAAALWLTIARSRRLRDAPPPFIAVAAVAILLRFAFVPFDPALSQDVQRYRWDGLVALAGINPYAWPPDAPHLAHLRTSWHALINHPEIASIYPPVAEGLFALFAAAGGSLLAWRIILLCFDLATIRMLSPRNGWLWATCPLVVVEGFWSAHLEIVAAALLLASARAVLRRETANGAIAAGLAAGVKVVPLAALPALVSFSSRKAAFVAIALVTLIAPILPFVGSGPMMPGFGEYARRWEFNAPLYGSSRWLVDTTGLDVASKQIFTSVKRTLHAESIAPFVYAQLHPERMARAICALAFLAGLLAAMRLPSLERRVSWSVAALLLASPALHPWYWLALLPLALESRSRLLVLLSIASPASYLLYSATFGIRLVGFTAAWVIPIATAIVYGRTMQPADRAEPQRNNLAV